MAIDDKAEEMLKRNSDEFDRLQANGEFDQYDGGMVAIYDGRFVTHGYDLATVQAEVDRQLPERKYSTLIQDLNPRDTVRVHPVFKRPRRTLPYRG